MSLFVLPIPLCVGCCAGFLGQGSTPSAGIWEDPWQGLQQSPPRSFLHPPQPLWSRRCLGEVIPARLAGVTLSPPPPWVPQGMSSEPGSASHPPVLPGSPEGFPGSDRNSHRHRDLLVALSWFSRLRFHLVLSGESLRAAKGAVGRENGGFVGCGASLCMMRVCNGLEG